MRLAPLALSLALVPATACTATPAPQDHAAHAPKAEAPPVPTGAEYLAMTGEERYALRLKVRGLPDDVRKPWLVKLKEQVDALPEADRLKLHDERNAMDAKHGTKPVE
jgi:hypothetical protein